MLVFRCECEQVLGVEESKGGKPGACPGCGRIVKVPDVAAQFAKLSLKKNSSTRSIRPQPQSPPRAPETKVIPMGAQPAPVPLPSAARRTPLPGPAPALEKPVPEKAVLKPEPAPKPSSAPKITPVKPQKPVQSEPPARVEAAAKTSASSAEKPAASGGKREEAQAASKPLPVAVTERTTGKHKVHEKAAREDMNIPPSQVRSMLVPILVVILVLAGAGAYFGGFLGGGGTPEPKGPAKSTGAIKPSVPDETKSAPEAVVPSASAETKSAEAETPKP